MSEETVKAIADATKSTADLASNLLDTTKTFGAPFKGAIQQIAGALEDHVTVWRWEKRLKHVDRVKRIMAARGMTAPTRVVPPEFVIRLLEASDFADTEDLQELWANLLANAADASSGPMPRSGYVEILSRMTALDAHNLETLVKTAMRHEGKTPRPFLSTFTLPESSTSRDELGGHSKPFMEQGVELSVSNMIGLGLLESATGTFGGSIPIYEWVSVTPLGSDFYWACAREPQR
jgi:hypothetical protein